MTSAGLRSGATPLPVRFGESFDSDEDCRRSLALRAAELVAALERIDGKVEMTVAISLEPSAQESPSQPLEAGSPTPGRAYLERLRGEHHATQILQQQGHVLSRPVIHAVRHLVADERATLRPSPPTWLVSHLVPQDAVDEYRRLATAAIGERPAGEQTRAIVRGPSAPYSFATASG